MLVTVIIFETLPAQSGNCQASERLKLLLAVLFCYGHYTLTIISIAIAIIAIIKRALN